MMEYDEKTIRRMAMEDIASSSRTPKRLECIRDGELRCHRRGEKLYVYFTLPDYRLLMVL